MTETKTLPLLFWTASGTVEGTLSIPKDAEGLVILPFASSSRRNRRSTRQIMNEFHEAGLATSAIDLLTSDEEQFDSRTEHYRLDVSFLTRRLLAATRRLMQSEPVLDLPVGYFLSGMTAAAAFFVAERFGPRIQAMVCHRGVPDLAAPVFTKLTTPILLLVDEDDVLLVNRNRDMFRQLRGEKELILLSEDYDLTAVTRLASDWFLRYFGVSPRKLAEADAKGAVESQMQPLEHVEGTEVLGYRGEGREEHSGEPVIDRVEPELVAAS